MSDIRISTPAVVAAILELHNRTSRWPTRDQIAAYLDSDIATVKVLLKSLREQRVMRDRRQQGETRWMPWREV